MGKPSKEYKRYVFVLSDATGKTCHTVVMAALTQFKSTEVELKTISNVRTMDQINDIINKAVKVNGIIVYTVVSPEFRFHINELGRLNGIPTVDILGPLLTRFSDLLEISPLAQPGLFRQLDDDYIKRIEAVDFTIKHDDGIGLSTLNQAEIIIIGVSRTAKTPVSIYLSYRGWKVANIPVILDFELPAELNDINQNKIVAFTISQHRLQLIRRERQIKFKNLELEEYINKDQIRMELEYGLKIYEKFGWPVIDVTNKSIEETATEIMRYMHSKHNARKGNIPVY